MGIIVCPKIYILKSSCPVAKNVTVFEDTVLREVIRLKWGP